jgi:hypothetical protein
MWMQRINSVREKVHLKKTTFTYEKKRFHLESALFSISIRIALERYLYGLENKHF